MNPKFNKGDLIRISNETAIWEVDGYYCDYHGNYRYCVINRGLSFGKYVDEIELVLVFES